jgi:hypothetical protein
MYNFIYYFGAWAFAFTVARAVLAAVEYIETGGKKK